jgi:hypothetical protein
MSDMITAEEAGKLLDGATPGLVDHCLYHSGKRMAECPCMRDLAAKGALNDAAPDLARTVIALHADRDRLAAANAALEATLARLVGALVDQNDLLRSAMQIAKREGVEGQVASTNWDAYYNRVAVSLKRHHATVNEARAVLAEVQADARRDAEPFAGTLWLNTTTGEVRAVSRDEGAIPNVSQGWPLEEGGGSIIVGKTRDEGAKP